ncbi:MAG: N-6 DNA methylase [Bacteroidales bacterium]|nr:N-6 DNA methylase [Bacteroidales bacterium]
MANTFEILFNRLELNDKQGLFKFSNIADWEHSFPYRVVRALKSIKPYAIYAVKNNNEVGSHFVPVYLFIDNSEDTKQTLPKLWNFQTPVVIIDNGNQWLWYSGEFLTEDKSLNELISPVDKSQIKANTEIDHFSFWNIHSGSLWKKFEPYFTEEIKKIDKKKLQTYLLQNIEEAIRILTTSNDKIEHKDNRQIANNLIGRLIFVRYLIDRNVKLNFKYIDDNNQRTDFENLIPQRDKLYSLFEFLKSPEKFNGDLFPFHNNSIEEEKKLIKDNHLKILHELFLGEKVEEDKKQYSLTSLFDIYDFNIIPVELISNIYERFIGKERQRKGGAFYTPPFLVDYVLKHTIELHLEKHSTCKVLDPSCGSGIFLVETLRKIIEKNLKEGNINKLIDLEKQAKTEEIKLDTLIEENDKKLIKIVEDNIFGIDKDPNAVTIAIFSIYITILDYKEPREIENFKLPELIDKNFFIKNFFDAELDKIFENIQLDFILGNPPWGSVKDDPLHKDFVDKNKDIISDYQIVQSFTIRVKDFCKNTECALIIGSKILYNIEANKFREYFINNYKLNRVLELSCVRKQVFSGAVAPSAILFFKYLPELDKSKNIIHYISLKPNRFFKLFKIIVVEKYDYKKVKQKQFEKDWIWKVLLYGNFLDYRFFEEYYDDISNKIKIDDFVNDNNLTFGAGYKIAQRLAKTPIEKLKKYPVVKRDDLQPFFINVNNLTSFKSMYPNVKFVDRKGTLAAYKPPHLLIKRGISKKPVVAFSDFHCVYPNTVFSIAGSINNVKVLKALGALFSTSFYAYLMFFKSSQWGVERNEVYKADHEATQIINLTSSVIDKLSGLFEETEENAKNDFQQILEQEHIEGLEPTDKIIKAALKKFKNYVWSNPKYNLDDYIYEIYDIDKEEQTLIDYALNISIPLFEQKEHPFKPITKKDKKIENYINVFFEKNQSFLDWKGVYMTAEVYFDKRNYIIINFKYVKAKPVNKITHPNDKEKQSKFAFLSDLFALPENISENLFMQKDLRGFEETSFYVIKPNEFKNWHPAVAYLDYYEFKDAFLKAGKANKFKAD